MYYKKPDDSEPLRYARLYMVADEKTEKEGTAEKVIAKVKEVAKDAKDAVEGAVDGVKNAVKKDEE